MPLSIKQIDSIVSEMIDAELKNTLAPAIPQRYPDFTVDEAYKVQMRYMERKIEAGEKVIGKKIGLTSKAMQELLGIDEPDYGFIMSTNIASEGLPISMSELIEPKAEPEVAFVLMDDLEGPGVTAGHVLAATAGVLPSIEIIDSRFAGWGIKIQDSIADGASIGLVILGAGGLTDVSTPGLDLRYIGHVLEKNGEIVETAAGAAALGNPAESVAWLANKLSEYGIILKAGEIVISGSLTKAVPVQAGDFVRATFGQLGSVGIKFVE